MMDGRRHSVDIPISKTIIALRRVRSLRDPSTNSLSKLSAFVDNLNWETNSANGIILENVKGCLNENDPLGLKDLGVLRSGGNHVSDCEMYYSQNLHTSKLGSCKNSGWADFAPARTMEVGQPNLLTSSQEVACEIKSQSERYCSNYKDLTCMTPTDDYMEGEGSSNEPMELFMEAERQDHNVYTRKSRKKITIRSSKVAAGDVMSRATSPCLSMSDTPMGGSSCGASLYGDEDIDLQDADQRGCGIGYCWSRTPRFRGSNSNVSSDKEEQPLLTREVGVLKQYNSETTPYSEIPRSLSQKFRPKSFDELVGQSVVSKSLLTAIERGRITSFYLFHGPRGTGKTSAARIFAAALNCLSVEEKKPCGCCQECTLFFAGRSRDVKEVDTVSINKAEKLRYLMKNAMLPPVSSSFKVFIIDECQLMRGSTWDTLVNGLEEISRQVIFILITPDISKLPRNTVPRTQRFHFQRIKEADIVGRLGKICIEEGFEYDQVVLDFIATKSNGSLRDAETTLEQLSLPGKRITMSLAYELIGIVSDDELLELLAMALSSDTSNTVKRARELMRSRIDPMQLISQLANLIMDILAGKFSEGASEVKRQFFERHTSEEDLQLLNNALKILSETEKQLRASKSQSTWLTVALLQLSSAGSSYNANDSSLCVRSVLPRDSGDYSSILSAGESLKHLVPCEFDLNNASNSGVLKDKGTLESIWSRATEACESISLRKFLRKQGNLASVCFHQGLAVVELEFHHPHYVSKAEKSWKRIASALQATLGCNVEIRIYHSECDSVRKYAQVKKPSFSFFSCSHRMQHESNIDQLRSDLSENFKDATAEQTKVKDKSTDTLSSDGGSHISHTCCHRKEEPARTIRNSDGNALAIDFSGQDSERQWSCFPRSLKPHRKSHSSDASQSACMKNCQDNNLALSVPGLTSSETCFCTGDPYVICTFCENCSSYEFENSQRKDSKVHCWRTPTFPFKKAWQLRNQPQGGQLVEWVLPCATAK